jgi:glycosyltransferase involved in cell wall biosynthesis
MRKIFFVPIEPIKARYSIQWNAWFKQFLEEETIPYEFIIPEKDIGQGIIREGQFLDVIGTNFYKSQQLSILCQKLNTGDIRDNDVILFSDYWFPGVEMLFYIRDAMGLKFKIAGILHAGTWDEKDFLYQVGMARWARNIEKSWIEQADILFVASDFHKKIICKNLNWDLSSRIAENIRVVPFPIKDDISVYTNPDVFEKIKENTNSKIIVFPHRLAPEKQPDKFDALFRMYPDLSNRFTPIKTALFGGLNSKELYYSALAKSTFSISFALQETFGIAMLESVIHGSVPIIPNRLSYKELYPSIFKYSINESQPEIKAVYNKISSLWYDMSLVELQEELYEFRKVVLSNGNRAIPTIINHCLII